IVFSITVMGGLSGVARPIPTTRPSFYAFVSNASSSSSSLGTHGFIYSAQVDVYLGPSLK
ncbi:hypothetical protein ACLKA6_002581, partial [Drosophila palustris]